MKTTNYFNTFILIADDSPVKEGSVPPVKGEKKTAANMQYEILAQNPYKFSSDDILFDVFAIRNEITKEEYTEQKNKFFSKGQPCFRSSPLTKRYGWGVHCNSEGKIAIYGAESEEYERFIRDDSIVKIKAMRTKRV